MHTVVVADHIAFNCIDTVLGEVSLDDHKDMSHQELEVVPEVEHRIVSIDLPFDLPNHLTNRASQPFIQFLQLRLTSQLHRSSTCPFLRISSSTSPTLFSPILRFTCLLFCH